MSGTWAKAPSPCIGVCKFREGHCVGFTMTKPEKKAFKRLKKKSRKRAFLEALVGRLRAAARPDYWTRMYRRKCDRKDLACPLDKMGSVAETDANAAPDLGVQPANSTTTVSITETTLVVPKR